jgi:hypothetical protein
VEQARTCQAQTYIRQAKQTSRLCLHVCQCCNRAAACNHSFCGCRRIMLGREVVFPVRLLASALAEPVHHRHKPKAKTTSNRDCQGKGQHMPCVVLLFSPGRATPKYGCVIKKPLVKICLMQSTISPPPCKGRCQLLPHWSAVMIGTSLQAPQHAFRGATNMVESASSQSCAGMQETMEGGPQTHNKLNEEAHRHAAVL